MRNTTCPYNKLVLLAHHSVVVKKKRSKRRMLWPSVVAKQTASGTSSLVHAWRYYVRTQAVCVVWGLVCVYVACVVCCCSLVLLFLLIIIIISYYGWLVWW
jgi:hypothetical protein